MDHSTTRLAAPRPSAHVPTLILALLIGAVTAAPRTAAAAGVGILDTTGVAFGESYASSADPAVWLNQGIAAEFWWADPEDTLLGRFRATYHTNFSRHAGVRHNLGFGLGVQVGGVIDYGVVRVDFIGHVDAYPLATGLDARFVFSAGAGVSGWIDDSAVGLFAELCLAGNLEIPRGGGSDRWTVGPLLNAGVRLRFL